MTAAASAKAVRSDALRPVFSARTVLVVIAAIVVLVASGHRLDLGAAGARLGELGQAMLGMRETSQIGEVARRVGADLWPPALETRTPLERLPGVDPNRPPPFTRVERVETTTSDINPETLAIETRTIEADVLVAPFGYLAFVLGKMLETAEIALWATLLAIFISAPLAIAAARNYTPHFLVYGAARGTVSFLRAVPELISALFLVLAFGFGPVAGILALGLHSAGFLGKFYAEDIEAADPKPQDALRAIGVGKLKVLRLAVLPQVAPSYAALTLYILDRNIRMATVIGLVGAGGIGQELRGRYDLFQYDHVATILLVIFASVLALDAASARVRRGLI